VRSRPVPRLRRNAVALVLASALGTAGCADGPAAPDDGPRAFVSVPPAAEDPDGPAAAYRTWLAALAARDAAGACALQAPELTIELRQRAILEDRAEQGDPCVRFEALLWEDPLRETDPVGVEVTQETAEDAVLAVDLPVAGLTVRMVVADAAWRVLDESPRATGGTTADPQRWVRAWCSLEVGSGRDAVVRAMGAPSGVYTVADGGEPQLWWAAGQYDFRAYLDGDGPAARVVELVGDYDALTAADRSRLDCPELR
jgi:hypothetical protein